MSKNVGEGIVKEVEKKEYRRFIKRHKGDWYEGVKEVKKMSKNVGEGIIKEVEKEEYRRLTKEESRRNIGEKEESYHEIAGEGG